MNPDLNAVNLIRNGGYLNYNAMVVELRRRLSEGKQLNSSYTWSKTESSNYVSLRRPRYNVVTTTSIPHVFKAN